MSKVPFLALAATFPMSIALLGPACTPAGSRLPPSGSGGSSTVNTTSSTSTGGSGGSGGAGPGVTINLPDAGSALGGAGGTKTAETWPPAGYVNVTNVSFGAYALGPLVSDLPSDTGSQSGGAGMCSFLRGVIRDFKLGTTDGGHPDFEKPPSGVDDRGIVTDTLGDDKKPVYDVGAHPDGTKTTSGQANFDQWYRDTPDMNMAYVVAFSFQQHGNVVTFAASNGNADSTMRNSSYYPLDGQGFGNQGKNHNYAFTTEIHTTFTYNGGETFTFQGDDDVFVYINNHRVIDLGGIHEQETQTVDLDAQVDALGISKGNVYDLAVFNAERHTIYSNFRIDTTMVFEDCGSIIP